MSSIAISLLEVTAESKRQLRLALFFGASSWLLLVALTLNIPQGLHFFDPVLPLRAMLQWQDGQSPHWNVLQRIDPADLSSDRSEWLGWWAPGTSLLMLPGLLAGLQAGHLLRALTAAAILIGCLGWTRWFARFPLPGTWLLALAVSLPWMRYSSGNLFRYSAEVLAFAAAPWAFLALAKLPAQLTENRVASIAVCGLMLGFVYWLKFSLLVTLLSAIAPLAIWWFWSDRKDGAAPFPLRAGVFLIALSLAPLLWQWLGRVEGGATPLGGPRGLAWSPVDIVFVVANPALALADAFGPLFFAFVHPGLFGFGEKTLLFVAWLGVPGGLLLVALLVSALRRRELPAHLAIGAGSVFVATLFLAALRILGDVDQMPRHLAPVSLAALPVALSEGRHWWQTRGSRWTRGMLLAGALVYVAGPLLFGFAYVAAKSSSRDAQSAPSHAIGLWSLPADEALFSRLSELYRADPAAILVVQDPELTFLWQGRAIWQFASANVGEDLQRSYHGAPADLRWSTREPVSLHVLVRRGEPLPSVLRNASFTSSAPPWDGRDYSILSGSLRPLSSSL